MVKNIKLDTYFFKEYEKIVEKNTYSAYVPNGNKGIWSIASYNEGKKKKNSNFEKINLAQIGVRKTIEKYFENNDFSIENMEKIMKNSSKKVIFEKMNLEKNIENLEKIESESLYSQLNIMIDKDNMIVGNSGKTAFILYRENKILEKISGEKIKNIRLEKNDYLLAGSPEFWEVIDENELTEIHIDKKSKESVERNLSEKIKKVEKKINKVCSYLEELNSYATKFFTSFTRISEKYFENLNLLTVLIENFKKTDYELYNLEEKKCLENTVYLVSILYSMCKVKLVVQSNIKDEPNKVNKDEIDKAVFEADSYRF